MGASMTHTPNSFLKMDQEKERKSLRKGRSKSQNKNEPSGLKTDKHLSENTKEWLCSSLSLLMVHHGVDEGDGAHPVETTTTHTGNRWG